MTWLWLAICGILVCCFAPSLLKFPVLSVRVECLRRTDEYCPGFPRTSSASEAYSESKRQRNPFSNLVKEIITLTICNAVTSCFKISNALMGIWCLAQVNVIPMSDSSWIELSLSADGACIFSSDGCVGA